jgi:hypothetical protein
MEFCLVQDEECMSTLDAREYLVDDRINKLRNFKLKVTEWSSRGGINLNSKKSGNKKSAEEILIMPHVTLKVVEDTMMQVSNEPKPAPNESSIDPGDMKVDEVKEPATFSPASLYDTVLRSSAIQSHGELAKSTG